jgi:hypothetical protein
MLARLQEKQLHIEYKTARPDTSNLKDEIDILFAMMTNDRGKTPWSGTW